MRNRLDNRKPQIDPKLLRKHSKIVAKGQDSSQIIGDRTQTDYGFVISGYSGKGFETFYMCILASATTPAWKHDKKVRTYRVHSGVGYYMTTDDATGEVTTRPVTVGDEVVADAGVTHRFGTSQSANLELFVVQESKYSAHLVEVEPTAPVNVPEALLTSVSVEARNLRNQGTMPRVSRQSRAAEQIALQRGLNPRRAQQAAGPDIDTFMRGAAGVNAQPVADFDVEGAG